MKYFRLAGKGFRDNTDLRDYEDEIEKAVYQVKPEAEVTVTKTYYYTEPELGKLESIKVSEILRDGDMNDLTTYRPCLFNSSQNLTKKEQEENTDDNRDQDRERESEALADNCRDSERIPADQPKKHKKNGQRQHRREIRREEDASVPPTAP